MIDDPYPYNHPQPSVCHKTMAVKWHSELSLRGVPPLTSNLLSLLPQPTALHIRNSLASRMCHTLVVGLCCCSSNSSPSFTTAQYSVFPPLLLSSLNSCHRPAVAPQPPTVTAIR